MTGEAPPELVMVRFLHPIGRFTGSDGKSYPPGGPGYMPEDLGTIPADNARLLMEKGAVEKVDTLAPDVLETVGKPLAELPPEELEKAERELKKAMEKIRKQAERARRIHIKRGEEDPWS